MVAARRGMTPRRGQPLEWPVAAIAGAVLASLTLACERKAPGPEECHQAAVRILGIEGLDWERSPRARLAVDQIVVQCLTTPFDREFTRCLEERGTRICMIELERRLPKTESVP